MEIGPQLYVTERAAWRDWLAHNHASAAAIWLLYPRKHTNKPRINYNSAVEEALCFGWIDSTVKALDGDHTVQRFTPRRRGSGYSQTNQERLRRLIAQNKVLPAIVDAVTPLLAEPFQIAPDIEQALRANPRIWQNFERYAPAYRRIRIAYVESRRGRPDEFNKRLNHLLRMTAQDKQFGFNIESYY